MMLQRKEGHFTGYKGTELFYQTWQKSNANATLVVVHGISEHSECYNSFASGLANSPWNIYALDLRGHGRSEGKRGLVEEFTDYINDVHIFLTKIVRDATENNQATVLLGHSMGGLISSRLMIEHPELDIDALCLSSPAFGISMPVPVIKDKASHFLARFAPTLTLQNEINYAALSHDREMLNFYPNDPLRHDRISARLYLGMVDSFSFVLNRCREISCPVYMQVSGDDLIVSMEKQQEFYNKIASEQKEMVVYKNSYHEVFNDVERETAYKDLMSFLEKTLATKCS